jgi:hypothetical protein
MFPSIDTVVLLKLARQHEADVRGSFPRAQRRTQRQTSKRSARRFRVPALHASRRPTAAA